MAGRKSEVTVGDVRAAVARLEADGQPVRVTAIMVALGCGYAVAKRLLGEVEAEGRQAAASRAVDEVQAGQEVAAAPEVPEALVGLFRGLTQGWRALAVTERERADREAASAVQAARAEAERARADAAKLSAVLGDAERMLGERERELEDARRQIRKLESEVRRLLAAGPAPVPAAAPAPVEPEPVAPVAEAAEPAAPPVAEAAPEPRQSGKRGGKRAPITDGERAEALRLRAEGKGPSAIAAALGRDKGAISRLLHAADEAAGQA